MDVFPKSYVHKRYATGIREFCLYVLSFNPQETETRHYKIAFLTARIPARVKRFHFWSLLTCCFPVYVVCRQELLEILRSNLRRSEHTNQVGDICTTILLLVQFITLNQCNKIFMEGT